MSDPVNVTRALLVALREELGDTDPCGRAIIETAINLGNELSLLADRADFRHTRTANNLLDRLEWPEVPQ
jgi:hypothetical protein